MNIYENIAQIQRDLVPAALCTVVGVSGSTPRKIGAKMIVIAQNSSYGQIIGTIGGGAIEHHIRSCALKIIANNSPKLITTALKNQLGMCCGGTMVIYIEPINPLEYFLCFGAGHIAQALCPLVKNLGFEIYLIDNRVELLNKPAFKSCKKFPNLSKFCLDPLPWSKQTYVCIATHDHQLDQEWVEKIICQKYSYLALVGSTRKALMTQKRLQAKNISEEKIKKIICPAGLDIKAQTPQEIAVSIAAQIIQHRHAPNTTMRHDSSSRKKLPHGLP